MQKVTAGFASLVDMLPSIAKALPKVDPKFLSPTGGLATDGSAGSRSAWKGGIVLASGSPPLDSKAVANKLTKPREGCLLSGNPFMLTPVTARARSMDSVEFLGTLLEGSFIAFNDYPSLNHSSL
jgi:hypothetical protein